MNFGMFDRDEDRNKQDNIFEREKRTKRNKRSKETCTFGLTEIDWVLREHTNLWLKKSKKESTIN